MPHKRKGKKRSTPSEESKQGKRGLSTSEIFQLLRDIESCGSINRIGAKTFCDNKPEYYGWPATEQRQKVQNRIGRWKRDKAF
jgi:hypothetical protein